MQVSARIPDAVLADMLHRLSIAVAAGVDLRRALESEAERVPGRSRPAVRRIASRVAGGSGLGEACVASAGVVPELVAAMLLVGDRTGRLAEVLDDTSRSLSRSLARRRTLRAGLMGPAIRLVLAVAAIGVLIVVAGFGRGVDGSALDLLGLGLAGGGGVAAFLAGIAVVGVAIAAVVAAGWRAWRRRGWAWRLGSRVPIMSGVVMAAEAAAWCRAAALAAHAGIAIGELVDLASRAAPGVGCSAGRVEELLRGGRDLPEALAATGRLPRAVVEAVAVGEATGTTAEALDRVADHLDGVATRGCAAAVQAAGFVAWALVAALVAWLVIRVAATYARMIDDLARPR
ncbi:MAG: type II secretion system F family protein [Planctomycetaceae bacterium]